MHPRQTVQAHVDLGGRWLLPIHNGTFDLAMHAWYEPFETVLEHAAQQGVSVATPGMGERFDLRAPQAGKRWWREAVAEEKRAEAGARPRRCCLHGER